MSTEFRIPELGENVKGGDVLHVLVKVGDAIAVDQPVLELETDKATIEVPSNVAGTVSAITVKPGDKVAVGQAVLTLERRRCRGERAEHSEPAGGEGPLVGEGRSVRSRSRSPNRKRPRRRRRRPLRHPRAAPAAPAAPAAASGPAAFAIPELGENVKGGDVLRVLVKVGDTLAVDQPVVELETDKATIEVPSTWRAR